MALPLNLATSALRDLLGGRFRSRTPEGEWTCLRDPRRAQVSDVAILGPRIGRDDRAACRAGLRIVGPVVEDAEALEVASPELALATLVRHLAKAAGADDDVWLPQDEVVRRFGEIARFARIHVSATIGERTRLGAGVVIHPRVRIGPDCVLDDHAVVGSPGFGLFPDLSGRLERLPHRAGVTLESDVQIGAHSNIAAGLLEPTWIGEGSRLDALVHVGHNCRIGPGCVLAGQVGLAGSVELGARCRVGGQAGFADHVRLGADCSVAGQAGVTRSWEAGTLLVGFPARPRRQWLRDSGHSVPRQRTLPEPNPGKSET